MPILSAETERAISSIFSYCAQQLANIKLGIGATTNGENRENINIGQQTVRAVNVLKLDISLELQKF